MHHKKLTSKIDRYRMKKISVQEYNIAMKQILSINGWYDITQVNYRRTTNYFTAKKENENIVFKNRGSILPQKVIIDHSFETWVHENDIDTIEFIAYSKSCTEKCDYTNILYIHTLFMKSCQKQCLMLY
jgi:hypothetical protein